MGVTEEEPVLARSIPLGAFLDKGPERRDACTWPYHDDIGGIILGQLEIFVSLDENRYGVSNGHPVGQKSGSCTQVGTATGFIPHSCYRQVCFSWIGFH